MHLVARADEADEVKRKAMEAGNFTMGFTENQIQQAVCLEIWGTDFKDSGPDFCEFRLFDGTGRLVGSRRVEGF